MKKMLSVILIVIAMAVTLAGCGGGSSGKKKVSEEQLMTDLTWKTEFLQGERERGLELSSVKIESHDAQVKSGDGYDILYATVVLKSEYVQLDVKCRFRYVLDHNAWLLQEYEYNDSSYSIIKAADEAGIMACLTLPENYTDLKVVDVQDVQKEKDAWSVPAQIYTFSYCERYEFCDYTWEATLELDCYALIDLNQCYKSWSSVEKTLTKENWHVDGCWPGGSYGENELEIRGLTFEYSAGQELVPPKFNVTYREFPDYDNKDSAVTYCDVATFRRDLWDNDRGMLHMEMNGIACKIDIQPYIVRWNGIARILGIYKTPA